MPAPEMRTPHRLRGACRAWPAAIGLLIVAVMVAGCTGSASPRRIEIRIHYSGFDQAAITVPRGVPVTFVLINEDPIEHEWLIGDAAFHEVHRHGTEGHHGARPNEVSIPALTTVETTLTFTVPGDQEYICHLPFHEAYGMVGVVTVT